MSKLRLLIAALCLVCISSSIFAQTDLKMLTPEKMQNDLDALKDFIDGHPDPYAKLGEEQFEANMLEAEQAIANPLDIVDFYKVVAKIVASLGDGHSSARLPLNLLEDARKEHGAFPYEVYLTNDDRLYVTSSYGDNSIPLGAEILAINGVSVSDFVQSLSPLISFETTAFRNDNISKKFELWLFITFKRSHDLKFKYKVIDEVEIVVPTMPFKEWKSQVKDQRDESE